MAATHTKRLELVETNRIFEALQRLRTSNPSYDDQRWRRALYHALCMTDMEATTLTKIREALHLP